MTDDHDETTTTEPTPDEIINKLADVIADMIDDAGPWLTILAPSFISTREYCSSRRSPGSSDFGLTAA